MKIELSGFPVLLFLIFLTLKLCGLISWSWWWVTCPLWIIYPIVVAILLGSLALITLISIVDSMK